MESRVEELLSRAHSLGDVFEEGGEPRYIDGAIALDREALGLCTPGHPQRLYACLIQLSLHLSTRYNRLGGIKELNEAIAVGRDALALCPPGHPDRSVPLNNLAADLSSRYNENGEVEDLKEAILLDRDALALRPPGHPERSMSLNNLALHLSTRYKQFGGVEDLNEATLLARAALALHPPEHPDRSLCLSNLALHLSTRYYQLGEAKDLDEAITHGRDALALRPSGHSDWSMSLNNLAVHLSSWYDQLGGVEDLNEAILLNREALVLRPPGHPHRSESLNNLALHLTTRYSQLGEVEDLNEAVLLDRNALTLCPPGHPGRPMSLNNLAIDLCTRYNQLGKMEDLDEAILLDRDAMTLCPPGHSDRSLFLNNLSVHLSIRYKLTGRTEDLNNAILLVQEALKLRPRGHPNRSESLERLARYLSARFTQLGDLEDRDELFSLYTELEWVTETVSSYDLCVAKAWINAAEDFYDPTTLLAYETALRLLVQHLTAVTSLPQHLPLLKSLTSSLAADAFSAYLRDHSPAKAVELLEQGRGVFWSQLTRLRSPLDDVVASGPEGKTLAEQFTCLTSLIRTAFDSPGADQHDRVCRLNLELQATVSSIRKLPGLSRFILPPSFAGLQRAANGGPVIIMNASKHSCDALVVFADRDPVHIPLYITKEGVRELASKLYTLVRPAKRSDVTKDLCIFLRELWDKVVSPIANFLLTTYPRQSRIWWCPTAEFSLLPLHAAAPYRKGQPSFTGLYVSSYTPTLSALIRARGPSPSTTRPVQKRFIAIGQANAAGTSKLVSVGTELANIGQCIDGLANFTCIEGKDSCISKVTDELSKNEWVHLACHGLPNRKQPFESAFALHDGHLTIHRLIGCDLKNPEFAYLSACHTTVGDEESLDEVIHLASAMQFAGFRSVIGTMWAVDDAETNKITSTLYKLMTDESGRLDHTRAAFALRKTMKSVNDVPLDQRILYIHLGA